MQLTNHTVFSVQTPVQADQFVHPIFQGFPAASPTDYYLTVRQLTLSPTYYSYMTYSVLVIIIIINVKINVALSENASRTWYTIKIKLKLRKQVLKKKSFQLSSERRE